jgi:hypothetical protein
MRYPDKFEECFNYNNCKNLVPFLCDDVSQEPGELPRASYIVEEGMGFVCACDNIACPDTSCGHFALKECGECAFEACAKYGTP